VLDYLAICIIEASVGVFKFGDSAIDSSGIRVLVESFVALSLLSSASSLRNCEGGQLVVALSNFELN
jgi:hypothetical protein